MTIQLGLELGSTKRLQSCTARKGEYMELPLTNLKLDTRSPTSAVR